ncbi:helix-turn-helix transcriptional regulator [Streptomyces sp. NPDC049577]|uniref:helix-turn-helix domain-containing protein n=1 Tax=Streptomyces sp. NPDC049577 TaxID=3155153 RepID=UPI003442F90B
MTDETSQPPMAWRYCGNQIKLWRTDAGVSREDLAQEAGYGLETVKSMEQGRRRPTVRLLQIADEMCGARGKLLAGLDYLKPEPFPQRVQDYMRYEADAVAFSGYHPLAFPGLLQTEETMRTMFEARWPPVDDDMVQERVEARLARQAMLQKQTTSFSFVIQEAVLRHRIGEREEHRRQLLHLLKVGEQRNVMVQVMETGGWHSGLNGAFILLDMPESERLAYVEAQGTSALYATPEKVSEMAQLYSVVAAQALRPRESARLISKLAEEQ